MTIRLVRVGNSRGVRLPEPLIEQAGLTDEAELRVRDGAMVVARVAAVRSGWAARRMRERDGDGPGDPPTPTRFDEGEWKW